MDKSILEMVRESAEESHKAGVMVEITFKEFNALSLPPVKQYTPAQIQRIRKNTKASQSGFALYLNITVSDEDFNVGKITRTQPLHKAY